MISTTAACGYLPRAPYIGGPLDGHRATPLRRKTETIHPQYRTPKGRAVRGSDTPTEPHYTHVETEPYRDAGGMLVGWGGHYRYVEDTR